MNDEQIFELAEKIGFQDDFGRWNFTNESLMDFVFMVQKREWVGLTDGEVGILVWGASDGVVHEDVRTIEAKLKEKNT